MALLMSFKHHLEGSTPKNFPPSVWARNCQPDVVRTSRMPIVVLDGAVRVLQAECEPDPCFTTSSCYGDRRGVRASRNGTRSRTQPGRVLISTDVVGAVGNAR